MGVNGDCFICYEAFGPGHEEIILPCLHSVCQSCKCDILAQAQEKNELPRCFMCAEAFDVISTVSTSTVPNTVANEPRCTFHVNSQVDSVCETCQIIVCSECHRDTNNDHCVVPLDEAAKKLNDYLQSNHAKVVDELLVNLEEAQSELSNIRSNIVARSVSICKEITTAFEGVISGCRAKKMSEHVCELEARRNSLITAAQAHIKNDLKAIQTQLEALEVVKDQVVTLQQQAKAVQASSKCKLPIDLLRLLLIVCARTRQLEQVKPTFQPVVADNLRFQFCCTEDVSLHNIPLLGSLTCLQAYTGVSKPITVFGGRGTASGQFHGPIGMAAMADGNLVVADCGNTRLQVFSPEGVFIRKFPVLSRPYHIAAAPTGEIWIAASDVNALLCYSHDGVYLRQISMYKPYGVAVSPQGIIVSSCFNENCIKAFSPNGHELWVSTGAGFRYVCGVAVTAQGEVVACDKNSNRLQVLSITDGRFLRFIGVDVVQHPRDVAVIPDSNQVVVAEMNRVSVWTLNDERLNRWSHSGAQSGKVNGASRLTVLPQGRVAVADFNTHRVQLF